MDTSSTPSTPRAGVLGLGLIGSRVADGLTRRGSPPAVWNRTPRQHPGFCSSPAAVADAADVLQIFVADDEALRSVVAALRAHLTPRHVVCSHCTVAAETTRRVAAEVESAGAAFLDAPFTGSRDAAAAGQIVYYVGGPADALDRARPVLAASAKAIRHVGRAGDATALKLATNILAAAAVGALAEAITLLRRQGVDPALLANALDGNAARSPVLDMKLPGMIGRDFAPRFSCHNMHKDLRDALDSAETPGVELPVTRALARIFGEAAARGHAGEDTAAVIELYPPPPVP